MAAEFGEMEVAAPPPPAAFVPEMPEIKLFGKWPLEEVQLNDMSLQVCLRKIRLISFLNINNN